MGAAGGDRGVFLCEGGEFGPEDPAEINEKEHPRFGRFPQGASRLFADRLLFTMRGRRNGMGTRSRGNSASSSDPAGVFFVPPGRLCFAHAEKGEGV